MAISLTHTTVATGTDAGNGEIRKAQWNEAHTLTMATDRILGRTTAAAGAVEELSVGTGLALSAGSLTLDADLQTWAGITPASGIGTWLATPSSANLAAAVTDETGSGALVFGTSPTIASPTLSGTVAGAPTASGAWTFSADVTFNGGEGAATFGNFTSTANVSPIWIVPSDWGTGKPGFYITKTNIAATYNISLWDGVNNNGTINITASSLLHSGNTVLTTASAPSLTGNWTFGGSDANVANFYRNGAAAKSRWIETTGNNAHGIRNNANVLTFDYNGTDYATISTSGALNLKGFTSTFNGDVFTLQPSDYAAGKPYLSLNKSSTADLWNVVLYDGSGNAGTIQVYATKGLIYNAAVAPTSTLAIGYLGIPQTVKDASYTLVLADAGGHLYHTNASTYTWTIPANSSVAYPIGTVLTFINDGSGNITIAITTDTLAWGSSTGSRTLAQYGIATATKVTSTKWMLTGNGIT